MNCHPQWNTLAVAYSPSLTEVLILQGHDAESQYRIVGYRNEKWLSLLSTDNYSYAHKAFQSLHDYMKLVPFSGTTKIPVLPSGCGISHELCTEGVKDCPVCGGPCSCCLQIPNI